jgi:hypothetical protein
VAVVFKSMLVAAALLLVGFGAAGAVWAEDRHFVFPPNLYLSGNAAAKVNPDVNPDHNSSPIFEPSPVAPVQRPAFSDHVWVNSKLLQAPTYTNAPKAWTASSLKEAADAARSRKSVKEMMSRAQKRASELSKSTSGGAGKGQRPRFMFKPSICRFGSADRPLASDERPVSAALLLKAAEGH